MSTSNPKDLLEKTKRAVKKMVLALLVEYGALDQPGDFASLMGAVSVLQYELVQAALLSGADAQRMKISLGRCYAALTDLCDTSSAVGDLLARLKGSTIPPKQEQKGNTIPPKQEQN